MITTIESIAEHLHRVTITPRTHHQPDGTSYRVWECTIDLRSDPPHHFATGRDTALAEAMRLALERAERHIALARTT